MIIAERLGFREFGGGGFGFAFEGIDGGEVGVNDRQSPIRAARLFEPDYRLLGARLQQMHHPDPPIPKADGRIAGTKPDALLLERDRLLYRPCIELAPAE